MSDIMLAIFLLAVLAFPYGYLLVTVCSSAYFRCKLHYHTSVLNHIESRVKGRT